MPDVICNTSPLQYLHQAGVLELLPALAGHVYVPEAVVVELREGQRRNILLPTLEEFAWLTVRPVRDRTRWSRILGMERRKCSLWDWKQRRAKERGFLNTNAEK